MIDVQFPLLLMFVMIMFSAVSTAIAGAVDHHASNVRGIEMRHARDSITLMIVYFLSIMVSIVGWLWWLGFYFWSLL